MKTRFPHYDLRILKFLSNVFTRKRISHINELKKIERAEKKAAAAEKKAEKAAKKERKEEGAAKKDAIEPEQKKAKKSTSSMNLRSRMKIGQFDQ